MNNKIMLSLLDRWPRKWREILPRKEWKLNLSCWTRIKGEIQIKKYE